MPSDYSPTVPSVPVAQWTYAGFRQRFAAGFIDLLVVGGGFAFFGWVLALPLVVFLTVSGVDLDTAWAKSSNANLMALIGIYWLYFAIQHCGPARGTLACARSASSSSTMPVGGFPSLGRAPGFSRRRCRPFS